MKKKPTKKKKAKARRKTSKQAPPKQPAAKSNHWRPTVHREGVTVPITFTIPKSMLAQIDEMAREQFKSRSVIIVDMLRDAGPLSELVP